MNFQEEKIIQVIKGKKLLGKRLSR